MYYKLIGMIAVALAAGGGAVAAWFLLEGEARLLVPAALLLAAGFAAHWAVGRLLRPLHETAACLRRLAGGQAGAAESLACIQASGEIGQLLADFRTLLDFQHRVLNNFGVATETMVDLAVRVINIAKSAGEKIRNQARQSESVAIIGERMSMTILEVARNANDSALAANQAAVEASQGSKVVGQTVEEIVQLAATVEKSMRAIADLGQRSQEIGRITQMIDEVADQTNLLALNAAIEAARAGEHGRGFAVVAEEVRGLSKRTAQATQEIAATIRTIQDEISQACRILQVGMEEANRSVEMVQAAGESLQRIVEAGRRVDEHIHSISVASEEHVSATDEIAENITEVHFAANKNDEAIGEVISESLMVLGFAKTTHLVAGFALGTVRGEPLESFARVALQNKFPKRFYERLMAAHSSIPGLFSGVDWSRQEAFFRTGLLMLLLYNQGEADAENALRRVAYTHGQGHLNLSKELYPLWVDCLIATLAECDPRWSSSLEQSWRGAVAKGISFLSASSRNA